MARKNSAFRKHLRRKSALARFTMDSAPKKRPNQSDASYANALKSHEAYVARKEVERKSLEHSIKTSGF